MAEISFLTSLADGPHVATNAHSRVMPITTPNYNHGKKNCKGSELKTAY